MPSLPLSPSPWGGNAHCRALGLQLAPLPRYSFSPPIPQFQAALEQKPFSLVVGGAGPRQVPFLALPVGSGVRA